MVDAIESRLAENQWLGGQNPSKEDSEQFVSMAGASPNVDTHPNAFAWFALVSRFTDDVRSSWTAAAPAAEKGGKKGGKGGKKDAPKKAAAAAEADEFDPFADDGEEDDGSAAAAMKEKAEAAKKKKAKAAPIAKSLIIWEVKPWGEETDLNALAEKILAIELDGLFWKTEWKKEPVAYGVFKIQIGATVEDAKVSTDDVQERIEAFEDDVQSVDIVAFNKL